MADEKAWQQAVEAAFSDAPALGARILQVGRADTTSQLARLFGDIAAHILASRSAPPTTEPSSRDESAPASKKRRLEDGDAPPHHPAAAVVSIVYDCPDVSVQMPARKKQRLQIVQTTGASASAPQTELRLLHPTTGAVEHTLAAHDVAAAFCLPVPDKQARQWTFALLPPDAGGAAGLEQVAFTMTEAAPTGARCDPAHPPVDADTYVTLTERELARMLLPSGRRVVIPREDEFASRIPQAHRRGEKAYHVKAHRGSKEGYLFFLETGIVFGFKKPLAFFPFAAIDSISYTSVLQRTFNLVIAAIEGSAAESGAADSAAAKEIEFSMLDQADFAGIDEYVRRHGLHDASMAADRRAKAYNVNKERKAAAANGEVDGLQPEEVDGQTELQKAEQLLQDEEDEEEEDYEVSGGESDGEGRYSSEEEEEDGGEGEGEWDAAEEVEGDAELDGDEVDAAAD